jgi:hypothetical protein
MKFLAIGGLVAVVFFAIRWLQSPRPRTRHLVVTVWAAFGPHETAEDAEDVFQRASEAVFGDEGLAKHQEWVEGHIKNFHKWQAEDRFASGEKIMRGGLSRTAYGSPFREACAKLKVEALNEAQESGS